MKTPCILTLVFAASLLSIQAADEPMQKQTVVYKQVGGLEIKADVYAFRYARVRPAVVWLHGGALINGHREGLSTVVRNFAATNGYVLVSFDYRLAPETKLPGIIEDVEDAFKWLRREGPVQFHIDPDRVAVTGGSAGGVSYARHRPSRPAAAVRAAGLLGLRGFGRRLVFHAESARAPQSEEIHSGGGVAASRWTASGGLPRSKGRRWRLLQLVSSDRRLAQGGNNLGSAIRGGKVIPLHAGEEHPHRLSTHRSDSRHSGHRCALRAVTDDDSRISEARHRAPVPSSGQWGTRISRGRARGG